MDIRHLEVFVMVCQWLSMTKAAEELGMSQPAISMVIKDLEVFYHVTLFERSHRKLRLTRQGELFYQQALMLLEQYHKLPQLLNDQKHLKKIRLGVNVTIGETCLLDIVHTFTPETLQVVVKDSSSILEMLKKQQLDLAIVDTPMNELPFEQEYLFTQPLWVIGHVSLPERMTMAQMVQYPFCLRETGSGNRSCVDGLFASHGYRIEPFVESVSDLCLLNMVEQQRAITFLPQQVAQYALQQQLVKHIMIDDVTFERQFYLFYSKSRYVDDGIAKLMTWIRRNLHA